MGTEDMEKILHAAAATDTVETATAQQDNQADSTFQAQKLALACVENGDIDEIIKDKHGSNGNNTPDEASPLHPAVSGFSVASVASERSHFVWQLPRPQQATARPGAVAMYNTGRATSSGSSLADMENGEPSYTNNNDPPILIQATKVEEEEEDKKSSNLPMATAQSAWSRRTLLLLGVLLGFVRTSVAVVAVFVFSVGSTPTSESNDSSASMNDDALLDHEQALDLFLRSRSFDGGEALKLYASPQRTALRYIAAEFPELPLDEKLIDIYATACFFFSTGGTFWTNNTKWKSAAPVCIWHGVDCDENGHVVSVALASNNLSGKIPPELGLLAPRQVDEGGAFTRGLTRLNLSYNRISGDIPEQLSFLVSMEELKLDNNSLSGEIPAGLSNLTALRHASFTNHNNLHGEIPDNLCIPDERSISVDCGMVACRCCVPSCSETTEKPPN